MADYTEQKSNRSELSFSRHYKSADSKPDVHFSRNGTIKTVVEGEVIQVNERTAVATKSNKLVSKKRRRVMTNSNTLGGRRDTHNSE
jgi:hypothetical protein